MTKLGTNILFIFNIYIYLFFPEHLHVIFKLKHENIICQFFVIEWSQMFNKSHRVKSNHLFVFGAQNKRKLVFSYCSHMIHEVSIGE